MQPMTKATTLKIFEQQGGILRTSEALAKGIQPRTLYALRDTGALIQLARGLYRLNTLPPLTKPDLVVVAQKIPTGVICLISALAFHDLTTEIPHYVYVALPRHRQKPHLDYPPTRYFWFSPATHQAGVERHQIDGIEIPIFTKEKSIADCFKFRHKLGLEVALDALKNYMINTPDINKLLAYAHLNRVANVMKPYLEILL